MYPTYFSRNQNAHKQDDWKNDRRIISIPNNGEGQPSLNQRHPLSYHDYNNQFISSQSHPSAQNNGYSMDESYQKKPFFHHIQSHSNKPYYNRHVSSSSYNRSFSLNAVSTTSDQLKAPHFFNNNKQQSGNPKIMVQTKKRPLSPMPPIESISSKNKQRAYNNVEYNINPFSTNKNNKMKFNGFENNMDLTYTNVTSSRSAFSPVINNHISQSQNEHPTNDRKYLPNNRLAKREKILGFKPWPETIYNMDYINTRFSISSKYENEPWFKSPKNFLNNLIKTPINWESFGPDDNKLHRATLTLEIGGSIIVGHGDAKTKKDAEKIAYLYVCFQIKTKGLIYHVQKCPSTTEDSKKLVIEYCARFDHVPNFELIGIGPDHNKLWEARVELPSQGIIGRGRAKTKKDAELLAAEDFKKFAAECSKEISDECQELHGGTLSDYEKNNMSEDIAKDFIRFYCKCFKFKNSGFNYYSKGPGHSMMWEASLVVEDVIIGTGQRSNKRDAQAAAYLDAAIALRKDSPDLWENYEFDKLKSKDMNAVPYINIPMSGQACETLNNLVSELQQADMFHRNEEIIMDKRKQMEKILVNRINKKENINQEQLTNGLEEKSLRIYESHQIYLNSSHTIKLRSNRSQLPINSFASTILGAIEKSPVIIIVGSTGCGKTTQLPQLILEAAINKNQGARCNIVVTQPRRIAAISVAQRVAYERSERLGLSVGYQVRFESVLPAPAGSILYCTTGVFLRRMHEENNGKDALEGVTHIVIDEVHERDMNVDFLLIILKRILTERHRNNCSSIKLILMSATIDTGIFAEYFGDLFANGRCPVVEIPGKSYSVQQYFIEDFVSKLGTLYKSSETPQLYNKDTLRYIDREKKILQQRQSLPSRFLSPKSTIQRKYIVMDIDSDELDSHSIEIDDNDTSSVGSTSGLIDWTGSKQTEEQADAIIPYDLISLVIAHIVNTTREGAILVFLPGLEEIMTLNRLFTISPYPLGINFSDQSLFRIHMLHSSLPSLSQQEVFEPLPNPNMRKIILATNIAETSITIPDVVHVVDSGKVKERRYDQSKRMTNLVTTWISRSNSRQRAGRAGRVREGEYFVMMSHDRYQNLEGYSTPEMLRSDLQEICLHIKALDIPTKIEDVLAQAIQPPDHASVSAALENLISLQALDSAENLTPLGKVLAILPMEPGLSKMVLLGAIFQCLDPILTIAACMSSKSPFLSPPQAKERVDEAKVRLAQGLSSDHLAILNAYKIWHEYQSSGNFQAANKFCTDNFLNRNGLQTIEQVKIQLLNLLERIGVVPKHYPQRDHNNDSRGFALGPPEYNVNSNCIPLLRSLICAGGYPNISLKTSKKTYRTRHENITFIHPASVNYKTRAIKLAAALRNDSGSMRIESNENLFAPVGTLYAYSTKVKTSGQQVYLRNTTRINPLSVVLFGGEIKLGQQSNSNNLLLTIDEWLQFGGNDKVIELASKLKFFLENCLAQVYERLDTNVNHNNPASQNNLAGKLDEKDEKVKDRLIEGIVEVLDQLDRDSVEKPFH
ncbi:19853_t:CDS:1 [Funneliformis geosporum]|uniref:3080_t:CDS:1 n=1 Tax=Funneliformis geosporum TaxID=1117311 RepID=A0A9W4SPY2_9GLOM|nr:19853_t:CDS:1 [Funneliformis geosporum]CAI2177284.1 3080_t:CDS:1 [Funneliformis geosporum]